MGETFAKCVKKNLLTCTFYLMMRHISNKETASLRTCFRDSWKEDLLQRDNNFFRNFMLNKNLRDQDFVRYRWMYRAIITDEQTENIVLCSMYKIQQFCTRRILNKTFVRFATR